MNIDPNSPAFPTSQTVNYEGHLCRLSADDARIESVGGLTIRQHFAAMAMQGQIAQLADIGALKATVQEAKERGLNTAQVVAMVSVEYADALIAELNKEGK